MQSIKLHGFRSLNRFGVNVPYRKHDFSDFFAYMDTKISFAKPWIT